jgi:hypothetical protein
LDSDFSFLETTKTGYGDWLLGTWSRQIADDELANEYKRTPLAGGSVHSTGCMLGSRSFYRSARAPRTLLHSDTHVANTYIMPNGAVGLLDWQLARRGGWEIDVSHYLQTALTIETRRAIERELVTGYIDELRRLNIDVPHDDVACGLSIGRVKFGEYLPGS